MERRDAEWNQLQRTARLHLENAVPLPVELRRGSEIVRVWHYPPWDAPHRAWTILSDRDRFFVRRLAWDWNHDSARLGDPMAGLRDGFHTAPAIEVRERELDRTETQARLDALHTIHLDFVLETRSPIIIDGESFGVATEHVRLEWCGSAPPRWRALEEWTASARAWLEGAV